MASAQPKQGTRGGVGRVVCFVALSRVVWCVVVWTVGCRLRRGVLWRCCVVWCGVVWCDVMCGSVVCCGVVWAGVVWRGVVWCGVMRCGVVGCGVMGGVGMWCDCEVW
jgi:hypothetical protein